MTNVGLKTINWDCIVAKTGGNAVQDACFDGVNTRKLRVLSLSGDKITGALPEFKLFCALEILDLSYNQFTGTFPVLDTTPTQVDNPAPGATGQVSMKSCHTKLWTINVAGNKLTGPIVFYQLLNL